jgi:large subunit ribosomal protein L21
MSFAVIQTGGKQYKVSVGDILSIEKISGHKEGDKVVFDKVLLTDSGSATMVGNPYVSGAKVSATILEEGRGKKKLVVKYMPKSRYFKKNGHRQPYMKVKIESL